MSTSETINHIVIERNLEFISKIHVKFTTLVLGGKSLLLQTVALFETLLSKIKLMKESNSHRILSAIDRKIYRYIDR